VDYKLVKNTYKSYLLNLKNTNNLLFFERYCVFRHFASFVHLFPILVLGGAANCTSNANEHNCTSRQANGPFQPFRHFIYLNMPIHFLRCLRVTSLLKIDTKKKQYNFLTFTKRKKNIPVSLDYRQINLNKIHKKQK